MVITASASGKSGNAVTNAIGDVASGVASNAVNEVCKESNSC